MDLVPQSPTLIRGGGRVRQRKERSDCQNLNHSARSSEEGRSESNSFYSEEERRGMGLQRPKIPCLMTKTVLQIRGRKEQDDSKNL